MRIGIDARGLRPSLDGIGRYTANLLRGLLDLDQENEYVLFALPEVDFSFLPSHHRTTVVPYPHSHLSPATVFRFGGLVRRNRLDLFHIPFFVGPLRSPVPTIVTVHDLMALTFPRFFSGRSLPGEAGARLFHRVFVSRTIRRADLVFADSEHTRREVIRVLGVPEERTQVIYPFVEDRFRTPVREEAMRSVQKELGLAAPYVLFFGNTKPYKNLPGILAGYADFAARQQATTPRLVILGPPDRFRREVEAMALALGISNQITFGGAVQDEKLIAVMKGAIALCFPSLEEGFGLPVLEAMTVGTPVVTSLASSLPEVAGEAALLVDPRNPSEIGQALSRIASDASLRNSLIAKGQKQAENFAPRPILKRILECYRRVAEKST
jgi:glycosyltransferase involved in cell wall biosynthesis